MAIRRLYNGRYQARVEGDNGSRLTKVFRTKTEALEQEQIWRQQKRSGNLGGNKERQITLDEYFREWLQNLREGRSESEDTGWLDNQAQRYRDYVAPILGRYKLKRVTPQMIRQVLSGMAKRSKSRQTRLHVFGMLRKMFTDAIEDYCYVTYNPVLRKLKPKVPRREVNHLRSLNQIKKLLSYVKDKEFGLGIWIQIYTGLRVGELIALRWKDLDLETGRLSVRRTFVRKKNYFRDYPKGGKQHTIDLPPELWEKLQAARKHATGEFVVTSTTGTRLHYKCYLKTLKRYCEEEGVPVLGTHGLRHTTGELYRSHGASKDDMQRLFAHSSGAVTERYLHGHGTSLQRVANTIQLFSKKTDKKNPLIEKHSRTDKKRTKLRLIHSEGKRRCS